MEGKLKLIILANDGFALAAANFGFPISSWDAGTRMTKSISSVSRGEDIQITARLVHEIVGLNPKKRFKTLIERLKGLPRGYSWKIIKMRSLCEDEEDILTLDFRRETIHKKASTEPKYQDYIYKELEKVWKRVELYYKGVPERIQHFRHSMLILEKINGDEALASDEKTLINILSKLKPSKITEKNPLCGLMYILAQQIETKRGVREYLPYNIRS